MHRFKRMLLVWGFAAMGCSKSAGCSLESSAPPIEDPDAEPFREFSTAESYDAGPSVFRTTSSTTGCVRVKPASNTTESSPSVPRITRFKGGWISASNNEVWTAWSDSESPEWWVQQTTQAARSIRLDGPWTQANAPWIVTSPDAAHRAVVGLIESATARAHRVIALPQGLTLATTTESRDESESLSVVATNGAVWTAWDDHDGTTSTIRGQLVEWSGGQDAGASSAVWSDPATNASEPTLLARADGSVVLAWLATTQIDASVAEETAADVYVRALTPRGEASGPMVRVSEGEGGRFALSMAEFGDRVWLAWRSSGDASVESQGDGGAVFVLQLKHDLTPAHEAVQVTTRGASPSGAPVFVPGTDHLEIFWMERSGEHEQAVTLRRRLNADGSIAKTGLLEQELRGKTLVSGTLRSGWAVERDAQGRPSAVEYRCADAP